ncbi:Epoxyqueuosine (oQ) reductase QueG [Geitlerinema sp. FC II]|nr:Epoxyqueuosine (oQ) reductase QueG [Geitlerinema sp. FC II]
MFQSLKGILVNFNFCKSRQFNTLGFCVSIPQRDFGEFQLNPEPVGIELTLVSIPQRDFGEFQRVKGYRVGDRTPAVSIPQRDFGEFQPEQNGVRRVTDEVSIPQRDFGEFQPSSSSWSNPLQLFQSLKGILVNFNRPIFLGNNQEI